MIEKRMVESNFFNNLPIVFLDDDDNDKKMLALAALRGSNEAHKVLDFERYLRSVLSRQHSVHTISELTESLNAIYTWVAGLKVPTAEDMKKIDRKVKNCWGSSSHDKSKKREKKSKHKSKKSEMQNVPSAAEL